MGGCARRGTHAPDARSRHGDRSGGAGGRHGAPRAIAAAGINRPRRIMSRTPGKTMRIHLGRAALMAATLTLAFASPTRAAEPNWPDSLTIGTASPGGTYYLYGAGL